MDVVAIHLYTDHNRSWEEQGIPTVVADDGTDPVRVTATDVLFIRSIVPGLRSHDVSVQGLDSSWTSLAALQDRFFARRQLVSFAPRVVTAARVDVRSVNYSGMADGLQPGTRRPMQPAPPTPMRRGTGSAPPTWWPTWSGGMARRSRNPVAMAMSVGRRVRRRFERSCEDGLR